MVSSRGPIKCLFPALSITRLKCEDMNETTLLLCYLEPSGYQYMRRLPKTLNFVEFEAGFLWKKHRKSVQRYESGPFALKGSSGPDARGEHR